jgi:hypothetical protein
MYASYEQNRSVVPDRGVKPSGEVKFSISCPDNCRKERQWICSVLLRDFLGMDYELRFDDQDFVRISADGNTLELNDAFFKRAGKDWLGAETLPTEPLQQWDLRGGDMEYALLKPSIPIIFGCAGFHVQHCTAVLELDIFGSAFFMLSRYEEAVSKQRDNHGRFPAKASLAYREGFLDRPIIDEYVEILWCAMKRLWPRLIRRQHEYKTVVSCDVDFPYHPSAISFARMARTTVAKVILHRKLTGLSLPLRNYFSGRYGDFRHDPYYFMVDWIMDVNERAGNLVLFNFIPEITDCAFDGNCSIAEPAVVAMLKRIAARQHEIGVHPGYLAYENVQATIAAVRRLRDTMSLAGIDQQVAGGRNHYLRWSTKTPAIWHAAGLQYDSTLSFADRAGFRCGTCREYSMYDIHAREFLPLKQRPLICMDRSAIDYMGYGLTEEAFAEMEKLKKAAKKVKGNFTLLWHNSYLEEKQARDLYCEITK